MDRGLNIFKTVYLELIGTDAAASDISQFLSARVGSDVRAIREYVVTTPMFVNKYSLIIRSLFNRNGVPEPDIDVVKSFLFKIADPNFDLDAAILAYTSSEGESHIYTDTHQSKYDMNEEYANSILSAPLAPAPTLSQTCIDGFEGVAKRPMTVYEYRAYADHADMDWEDVWKKQNMGFQRLRNLMHDYSETVLTEHDFLKHHLAFVHTDGYDERFIEDTIASVGYEKNIKVRLSKIYNDALDTELSAVDLDYLFQQVKRDRVRIVDPTLHTRVTEFIKKTNDVIAHASEVYAKVVDRYPDDVEIVDIVSQYRTKLDHGQALEHIGKGLEKTLIGTLEFHDVLRQRIQKVAQGAGITLIPSRLYTILREMLSHLEDLTMENLNAKIVDALK